MTYKELVRLATNPGPMQDMALQALAEMFAADDRADYGPVGHNEQFDIMRFAPEYVDAKLAAPRSGVPLGDMSREEEDEAIREGAGRDLMKMYDRLYPEPLGERVGGALSQFGDYITSKEGVSDTATMLRDTLGPGFTQYDSAKWADENMRKFDELRMRGDPVSSLTALGYLPLAAAGYVGTMPGAASIVSGGRKLGHGARALYEGLF